MAFWIIFLRNLVLGENLIFGIAPIKDLKLWLQVQQCDLADDANQL